jgi:hypothetical protein
MISPYDVSPRLSSSLMLQTPNVGASPSSDISRYFPLIAALIGALASWAAIFIKQWLESGGGFFQPKNTRKRGAVGAWTGRIADQFVANKTPKREGKLTLIIKTRGKNLKWR